MEDRAPGAGQADDEEGAFDRAGGDPGMRAQDGRHAQAVAEEAEQILPYAGPALLVQRRLLVQRAQEHFEAGPYVRLAERVDGHDADPYGLVGTVRSMQELAQMGAEHYAASVVLGEHAYSVRAGYLAVPVGEGGVEAMFDANAWNRLMGTLQALAAAP